jgi:hypothetical protein
VENMLRKGSNQYEELWREYVKVVPQPNMKRTEVSGE